MMFGRSMRRMGGSRYGYGEYGRPGFGRMAGRDRRNRFGFGSRYGRGARYGRSSRYGYDSGYGYEDNYYERGRMRSRRRSEEDSYVEDSFFTVVVSMFKGIGKKKKTEKVSKELEFEGMEHDSATCEGVYRNIEDPDGDVLSYPSAGREDRSGRDDACIDAGRF